MYLRYREETHLPKTKIMPFLFSRTQIFSSTAGLPLNKNLFNPEPEEHLCQMTRVSRPTQ